MRKKKGADTGTIVPTPERTFVEGYLEGLLATTWQCYDCGNTYQADIDDCPNIMLDEAHAGVRSAEWRRNNRAGNEKA